ncbi:MAG: hypothetical protein F6K39_26825 [Okeania sp. SIO3B3]|nr:hypothetical protein [Okeania sp. SIO3B3]
MAVRVNAHRSEGEDDQETQSDTNRRGLTVSIGLEAADRIGRLQRLDRGVDDLLRRSSQARQAGGPGTSPLELDGDFPAAVRSVPLSDLLGQGIASRGFAQIIGDATAEFSWTSSPSDLHAVEQPPEPQAQAADGNTLTPGGPPSAGWLAIGIGEAVQVELVARALSGKGTEGERAQPAEAPARWISMGDVRVSALADAMAAAGPLAALFDAEPFAGFERVAWRVRRLDARLVLGSAEITAAADER